MKHIAEFINENRLKMIPLILLFILFLFFIAPFFFGIYNIGNISGAVITAVLFFICLKFKSVIYFISILKNSTGGKIILSLSALIILFGIVILILINTFMIKSMNDYPKENSTVIVLGCQVKGTRPSLMLKRRLDSAYDYLSENPKVNVIVSGGKGSNELISEAECMKNYLTEKGISLNRIFMEDKSTSTYENLKFSKEIIAENNLNSNITIVTDGYHQCRAEMIAVSLGYEETANISAPTSKWLIPTYWVREWFGIIYQFLTGENG